VFLDSAYAIALASVADEFHPEALALADELEASATRLITTHAVLLEIGNALAKLKFRHAAIELLASLGSDPKVEVIPLSNELFERALRFYSARPDKEWGLTDCLSMIVMEGHHVTEVLTTDQHFQQAGFRALLRESPE